MIGRDWRAPIGFVLAVNSSLGRNRIFSLITLVSIVASVSLATSLEISSRAVQDRASRTSEALAGSAKIEIVGGEGGVPEELVTIASSTPGVAVASATINAVLHTVDGRLPIHVMGMDLLAGGSVRQFEASAGGVRINDPLRLLARPDAIVVSSALAARLDTGLGKSIELRTHLGVVTLRVEGILAEGGIASAFGSQIAVMDVFALQALMNRTGMVDRIDVVPSPGSLIDEVERELARAVGGSATVKRIGLKDSLTDRVLAAVRRVVLLIAAIGAVAAALVSYAAMSTSVERRLPEFSLLRSTGMAAATVRTWIIVEALAISAFGTAVGCWVGLLMGRLLVPVMARTTDYFAENAVEVDLARLSWATIGVAVGVGGAAALLGTVSPALTATRRWAFDPKTPVRGVSATHLPSAIRRIAPWLAICLLLLSTQSIGSTALRLVTALVAGTYLVFTAARLAVEHSDSARPAFSRLVPQVGHLIGTGLRSRSRSTALSVATIAGLVGFVFAIITLASSFSTTILAIVSSQFSGGVLVTAGPILEGPGREPISDKTMAAISSAPQVAAVAPSIDFTILYGDEEVDVAGVIPKVYIERGLLDITEGDPVDIRVALESGAVVVSEAFASRFGVVPRDTIQLTTPKGLRQFTIAGIVRTLAGPAGVIYLDTAIVEEVWERSEASSLLVWPASTIENAVNEIDDRVQGNQKLFYMYGEEMTKHMLKLANRFDSMIVAVASLAALLSSIAVANLLVGLVADRRVEFSMLQAAGASPLHLSVLVVCDAVLVMAAALLLGFLLGAVLTFPTLDLLRDEFGLSVDRSVDLGRVGLLALTLFGAALLSAGYPAILAHRRSTAEVLAVD